MQHSIDMFYRDNSQCLVREPTYNIQHTSRFNSYRYGLHKIRYDTLWLQNGMLHSYVSADCSVRCICENYQHQHQTALYYYATFYYGIIHFDCPRHVTGTGVSGYGLSCRTSDCRWSRNSGSQSAGRRGRCWCDSSGANIAGYRHVVLMAAVMRAPRSMLTLIKMSFVTLAL